MSRLSRFARCFCRNKWNELCESTPEIAENIVLGFAFVVGVHVFLLGALGMIWAGGSVVLFFMPMDVVLWMFDTELSVLYVITSAFWLWLSCCFFAFVYVAVVGGVLLGLCKFVVFLWSDIVLAWEQSKGDGQ